MIEELSIQYKFKLLIVDDDPEIHKMTKLIQDDFTFENYGIEIISANSGKESREILKTQSDIAVVFVVFD